MAGKTGTSQVRTISLSERESEEGVIKNHNLEWKYRDHALFVAYAPVKNLSMLFLVLLNTEVPVPELPLLWYEMF